MPRESLTEEAVSAKSGILLIDKPVGMTSHDVVDRVRRLYHLRRVGHTGTLDPAASGLLVIVLGQATKAASLFSGLDKTYEATVRFGQASNTGDRDGTLTPSACAPPGRAELIESGLNRWRGRVVQRVPDYAATRYEGVRRYELARRGENVPSQTRTVHIHELDLQDFQSPDAHFRIRCSSGTYIRQLAADLGEELGCGAYLSDLRRTDVGKFNIDQAHSLAGLEKCAVNGRPLPDPVPLEECIPIPQVSVHEHSESAIRHGRDLRPDDIDRIDTRFRRGDTVLIRIGSARAGAIATAGFDATEWPNLPPDTRPFQYQRVLL